MKKTILFAALALGFTTVKAQDFKPTEGSKTLEVKFAPLGGSPINISGIRFRNFKSATQAMRADVFIGFTNKSEITQDLVDSSATGVGSAELKTKTSSFEIGLMPGMEWHMAGTDRLSPYWGAALDLGFKSSKEVKETQTLQGVGEKRSVNAETTKGKDGFVRIGAMFVLGTDFYVAKSLYLGAEFGVGVSFKKDATQKYSDDYPVAPGTDSHDLDIKKGTTGTLNFGPVVNGQLRLGWAF